MKKIIFLIIASLNVIASIHGFAQLFKFGISNVGAIYFIETFLYILGAIAFALIALKPEIFAKKNKE